MTINIAGYVKIGTLNTAKNAKGNTAHQGALETIFQIIEQNTTLSNKNAATLTTSVNNGNYEGFDAAFGMPVRSCHGDQNLVVTIAGTAYNSVEPILDPQFKTGSVEISWWSYAKDASTDHVLNPSVDMAAFVEFNCTTFMHHAYLKKLQTQTKLNTGVANGNPKINIVGAGLTSLKDPDGPRVMWHIIGDFFLYSPDHYTTGYVVMDDNNKLFQTKNFF